MLTSGDSANSPGADVGIPLPHQMRIVPPKHPLTRIDREPASPSRVLSGSDSSPFYRGTSYYDSKTPLGHEPS